jgi:hypothetical protein
LEARLPGWEWREGESPFGVGSGDDGSGPGNLNPDD